MKKINIEYSKLYLKELLILFPKTHPNLVSFLTPILGLYGINVKEFINEVNTKLSHIDYDITIPLKVVLSKIKTYDLIIKTPYITTILSNHSNFNEEACEITLLTFYKIMLLKSITHNNYLNYSKTKLLYKMSRSYMSSLNRNIVYFDNIKTKKNTLNFLSKFYDNVNLYNKFLKIKNTNRVLKLMNNLTNANFGIFYLFYGFTNKKFLSIRDIVCDYKMQFLKLPTQLFNTIAQSNFKGIISFLFTKNFSFFFTYLLKINLETKLSLVPIYAKIGLNLCKVEFITKYLKEFNNTLKIINNKSELLKKITSLLFINYIHMIKVQKIKSLHLLKILKNKCLPITNC